MKRNRSTSPLSWVERPVLLNNTQVPQAEHVNYLGLHLDRQHTWRKHIFTKRKQLGLQLCKMYWMRGRNSQLNLSSKVLLYKAIIKPIWTYGIQFTGVQLPIQTSKCSSGFNLRCFELPQMHHGTSEMRPCITI